MAYTGAYLRLNGAGYVDTPDDNSLDITGDIDIRYVIAFDDWTPATDFSVFPIGKWGTNQQSYGVRLRGGGSAGLVGVFWDDDGTGGSVGDDSTAAPTVSDGQMLAVRHVVDVVDASNPTFRRTTFYTKATTHASAAADAESNSGWTQLGSAITSNTATSIFAGTASLVIGAINSSGTKMKAKVFAVVIKNGIAGTTVANPDFTSLAAGATSFTDGAGRTWTLHGDATVYVDVITTASETDTAQPIGVQRGRAVAPASETDTAPDIASNLVLITPAQETDTAPKFPVPTAPAEETDTAPRVLVRPLAAVETDSAPAVILARRITAPDAASGLNAQLLFTAVASVEKIIPEVVPPAGHVYLKRASEIMPPVPSFISGTGSPNPDAWLPTSRIIEDWGSFQVIMGGIDVSFYRSVPVQVDSLIDTEPFGDASAQITFPQISPFDADPSWLVIGNNIDIKQRVAPSWTHGQQVLFEGLVVSMEDSADGRVLQCIGALYQLDFYAHQPPLQDSGLVDIGTLIANEITPNARDRAAFRCLPINKVGTGIKTRQKGDWQPTLTGWIADLLRQATIITGDSYTVHKHPRRQPYFGFKDKTTVHWTMHVGQRGLVHNLSVDLSMSPNAVYGEGVDDLNCKWRNAKYPNLRPDDAPVFPGTLMYPGNNYGSEMSTFEQCMHDRGWTDFTIDGFYATSEEDDVKEFQRQAGITVDGIIGPQTWAAAFEVGSRAGDLSGAYMMALYETSAVRPYNHDAQGAQTTKNPGFNPRAVRVERYESFGSRITKKEGALSAQLEVERDNPPSYVGTLELTADPNEGSRLDIISGQNFLLKGHKGVDRLLHISQREIDGTTEPITVKLTVDEKARDYMTLGAILERDRGSTDPMRKTSYFGSRTATGHSHLIEDRVATWDCENGSGIIPRHATYKGLWNVLHIPAGSLGTIVRSEFKVETTPAYFAVGIFDRPVSANDLARIGTTSSDGTTQQGNPLTFDDYWDQFPDSNDPTDDRHGKAPEGLLVAWGENNAPGGIWPSTDTTQDFTNTGKLRDNATWSYQSQRPPWLWVAIYVNDQPGELSGPSVNYFSGRLFSSNEF